MLKKAAAGLFFWKQKLTMSPVYCLNEYGKFGQITGVLVPSKNIKTPVYSVLFFYYALISHTRPVIFLYRLT